MARHNVPLKLKQLVLTLFEYTCAACGKAESELSLDVAHLFEDATTRPPELERLIVLCKCCNGAQNDSKSPRKPPLTAVLSVERVAATAATAYRSGKYPVAYQSHRLAAYLLEGARSYSNAIAHLTSAVSSARPIRRGDLLRATILEAERICSLCRVAPVERWLFLDRLALTLYDFRRWEEAASVLSAASELRATIQAASFDQVEFERAVRSSDRRHHLIQVGAHQSTARALDDRLAQLREHADYFLSENELDQYVTHLDVMRKLSDLAGRERAGHELSQEALEVSTKVNQKWVLQEHYWAEAKFAADSGDRTRLLDAVCNALTLFEAHPVVLTPTLASTGPIERNFFDDLARWGITLDEVVKQHHITVRPQLVPVALALTKRQVTRVVTTVRKSE